MVPISPGVALAPMLVAMVAVMLGGMSQQRDAPQSSPQESSPQQSSAQTGAPQQNPPQQKSSDTFFAGSLSECTSEKISVSRVVSGKTENRTFLLTAQTKVENAAGAKWDTGKLKLKQRVTVRYVTGDDGDVATMIVVRTTQTKQK